MGLEPQSSSSKAWIAVLRKVDSQAMGRGVASLERTSWSSDIVLEEKGDQDLQWDHLHSGSVRVDKTKER